ncbi:MAG: PmoA family protein [Planctomycetaceae bacterium]
MRPMRAILVATVPCLACHAAVAEVGLERRDDRVDVTIDGEPFTSYVFAGHRKPILFPVHGPGGAAMTRSWPIVEGVAGEAHDHPHHESIWFTHGSVNGVDFWTSHPRAGGPGLRAENRIEQEGIVKAEGGAEGVLETRNRWVRADGTVVCTDTRRLVFAGSGGRRTIDHAITIHADHGPVTFGDTKEGTLALRVATPLQLKDVAGSTGAAGHCVNSAGDRDADVWGKRARWVDYRGTIAGRPVGVAVLDHPDNLRHPTHWHARDYGLVAANPFGLHDFGGGEKGAGDHVIPAGGSLTLRHLLVFHAADAAAADIDGIWRRWAGADTPAPSRREAAP